MTHVSNAISASIYRLTQEYPTNELQFFVYNNLVKTIPYDRHLTQDEMLEIMIDCGREWQEQNRGEANV